MQELGPVCEERDDKKRRQQGVSGPEAPKQNHCPKLSAREPELLTFRILISRSHPVSFPKPGFVSECPPVS